MFLNILSPNNRPEAQHNQTHLILIHDDGIPSCLHWNNGFALTDSICQPEIQVFCSNNEKHNTPSKVIVAAFLQLTSSQYGTVAKQNGWNYDMVITIWWMVQ